MINTGRIYEDMVQNMVDVIQGYKAKLDLKDVHDTELMFIQKFPCVTVEFDSAVEEWVEMPGRKRIDVTLAVTYYHCEMDEKTRRSDVRKQLDRLGEYLRENWDLNDFCNKGSDIESVTAYVIAPPGGQMIAGGRIMWTGRRVITVTVL